VEQSGSDRAGLGQGLRRSMALGRVEALQQIVRAGLRDRAYENLFTGERMAAQAERTGEGKRVVCECADIEPGGEIDRFLLASQAGGIVEGAFIAAFVTDSGDVVFHVAEDNDEGIEAIARAAKDLSVEGVRVEVVRAPFRRNMKGYEEVPTLRLTGETLLNVTRILRDGAEAYRLVGTPESPGTKFFQVSGSVERPGIFELPLGGTIRELIEEVCGGVKQGETLKAVIVGGVKGACYKVDELNLPLDFDSVRRSGGAIGSGAIAVLSEKDCIVDQARQRLALSCYDTCAACSLGREGSYQLREMLADATRGKSKGGDIDMMREIGAGMKVGAACAFGRTAPNIVLSTLEKFPDEYEAHMKRRLCQALVCEHYVTFHILPDLCNGCGECVDVCPEDAIEGGKKKVHVIDQDACEKCGKCYEVCAGLQKAVVRAGAVKPRTPKRPIPVGSWNG
jgi:NADH:ubiquinone oxidoreductase subunit F (NADH-binding)/Pyruvate/2-oxoacid:ferredoxin oxidoreductase delta subunit